MEFETVLAALRTQLPAGAAERVAFAGDVADWLERLRTGITESGMAASPEMLARIEGAIVALRLLGS
ncbi:hypothetical protein LCL87_17080 [Rhodococcus hoagii]|nr:hypothetical protein [Prescottella equi]